METSHLVCQFPSVSSEELVLSNPILRELSRICCYAQSINYYTTIISPNYCYYKLQYLLRISYILKIYLQRLCTSSIGCHSTLSYCSVSEHARKSIIGSTAVSSTFGSADIGLGCGPTVGFPRSFSALS